MKFWKSDRLMAAMVGVLILVAYSMLAAEMTDSGLVVLVTDVVSGLAVVGIAVLLRRYFVKAGRGLTDLYVGLKGAEGGLMVLGGLAYVSGVYAEFRNWIYERAHLWAFIISGFLFYWLLYKTKLVPRWLSVWGGVAIGVLVLRTVLDVVGLEMDWIEYLLVFIITNEVVLAGWLVGRGFLETD